MMNRVLESSTTEFLVIWFLMLAVVFSGTILLQSYFWYRYQATPGQKFVQLKLVNFPNPNLPLTYSQCLLRSVLWFLSALFFLVPFVEILGHSLRRAFHERASDTMVVTLKRDVQEVPHPIESRFIRSWLSFFFSGVLLLFVLFSFGVYNQLVEGKYSETAASDYLCEEISGFSASSERIEKALIQYLGRQVSSSCLNQEADYLLWFSRNQDLKNWGLLAKSIASPSKELRLSYEKALCEKDPGSSYCHLLEMTRSADLSESLAKLKKDLQDSKLVHFLKMKEHFADKQYVEAAQEAQALRQVDGLQALGNVYYVKSLIYMLREEQDPDRKPASLESEILVQNFLRELEE